MVQFIECRIDPERKKLIIEAAVDNLDYFNSITIDSCLIDTEETYVESGPSSQAIPVYLPEYEKPEEKKCSCGCSDNEPSEVAEGLRHFRVELNAADLGGENMDDHIFFVYVVCAGEPASTTPCNMTNSTEMAVALNMKPIYNRAMVYVRELADSCERPKNFIDMYLQFQALKLSFKTGHFTEAIKLWEKWFKRKDNTIQPTSNCGCHAN